MTLDGYTLESFGLKELQDQSNPLTAQINNKEVKIPGRAGAYDFGFEIGTKPFKLKVDMIENNDITRQQAIYNFVAFLHDANGKPRAIKMIFDYTPDRFYMVKLDSMITPERLLCMSSIELSFKACDPYGYSVDYADKILWGSGAVTFGSAYSLGTSSTNGPATITFAQTLKAYVSGLSVKPIIEISGTATNLILTCNGNTLNLGTFTNAVWSLDCDKYTVTKDNTNAFDTVKMRDFILLPGQNNIEISGSNINITIYVKFRDKYL